jgi:hypothetical protein
MAHVILFEHANFHGAHKHVFDAEPNLNSADDNFFNDRVSSNIVVEGRWQFFRDSNFQVQLGQPLGPGQYQRLNAPPLNMGNDIISSLRPI